MGMGVKLPSDFELPQVQRKLFLKIALIDQSLRINSI